MSLLAIVYQSLFVFGAIFLFVLTVSYISYKIKQKTNPNPLRQPVHDLQPAFAEGTQPIIPKNPYLNQNANIPKQKQKRQRKEKSEPANFHNYPRYTKIDTLYDEAQTGFETKDYGRHSSGGYYSGKKRTALHYENMPVKKFNNSLDGYDILNYYDENGEQQFYPFRTKY